MNAALQSISIPRHEQRSTPPPAHVVFAILVSLPVCNWTVYRRYSEFVDLHEALCQLEGTSSQASSSVPPPAPLPPKHAVQRTFRTVRTLGGLLPASAAAQDEEEEQLRQRRKELELYLRAIVASPKAIWRESQVFREFIELPSTTSSRDLFVSSQSGPDAAPNPSHSLKHSRYVPGSYSSPLPQQTPPVRKLGAAAQETETTRGHNDAELFASQQTQFDRQDAALRDLTDILRRQRQMGLAVNQELLEQNDLLDGLDEEVSNVQDKIGRNENRIKKIR